jgi:hypothetical protein
VSLILEALRKLERDKPAPERGVVVMTAGGLSGRGGRPPGWVWLVLGIAGGLLGALAIVEWRQPDAPSAGAPVASAPAAQGEPPAARPLPPTVAPAPARSPAPTPASAAALATGAPAAVVEAASPTPAAGDAPPAPALTLHAITVQEGQPVALINERVLRVGDEIDGVRVLRIGEAEVEVERDGQRVVLRF